jgi:acyl carrier protein
MDDVRVNLVRCFAAVFPDLRPDAIASATPLTVTAWDSIAHTTLLAVVEEQFGVEAPIDQVAELTSFESFVQWLSAR